MPGSGQARYVSPGVLPSYTSRLAGGIAHDFNNPLTAILSNTELVQCELPEGPVRQDVEVVRQTAERAAGLTRQLLASAASR